MSLRQWEGPIQSQMDGVVVGSRPFRLVPKGVDRQERAADLDAGETSPGGSLDLDQRGGRSLTGMTGWQTRDQSVGLAAEGA